MNECLGNPHKNYIGGNDGIFEGKTLLLAEDIAINREIVLSLLEETGIHVDCAANGSEAIDMISRDPHKYDAIFMDIQMPCIDGLEAARRIRAMPEPRCKDIPIIAMTANVFKEDVESCMEAGMNAHIGKPVDVDDMMEKLRKFLRVRGIQ
jgi:CheY-like chemotaxis protein